VVEIDVAGRGVDGSVVPLAEGDPAAVTFAPQGGFIMLTGVRAKNIDVCLDLTADVRDESAGGKIVSLEQRPVQLVLGSDGWLSPVNPSALYNWANLAVCPNAALTRNLVGQSYLLEMHAVDRNGVAMDVSRHVVPYCAEPENEAYCTSVCTTAGTAAFR
jgi:hypothetical protein